MTGVPDILVVDDDSDIADVMIRVLRIAGYSARSAANGAEALDAVARRRPALVLLDMLMPVMDGRECGLRLRAEYGRSLPIVVVTAAEHAGARAAEICADDVLAKPFDIYDLLRLVRQHAGLGEAQDFLTGDPGTQTSTSKRACDD